MKQEIVQMLEALQHHPDCRARYRSILDFVQNRLELPLTRNSGGYWFDLTNIPDNQVRMLYAFVRDHVQMIQKGQPGGESKRKDKV